MPIMRPPVLDAGRRVLVAEQEVRRGQLVVDERAGGRAVLDAAAVLLDPLLLRLERREVHAEGAHAAVGGVELGARATTRRPTSAGAASGTAWAARRGSGIEKNSPS